LRGAVKGDARREQRAGGVGAGVDGGAVEDDCAAVTGLGSELEGVGGGLLAGDGEGGGGAAVDGEGEGAAKDAGAGEGDVQVLEAGVGVGGGEGTVARTEGCGGEGDGELAACAGNERGIGAGDGDVVVAGEGKGEVGERGGAGVGEGEGLGCGGSEGDAAEVEGGGDGLEVGLDADAGELNDERKGGERRGDAGEAAACTGLRGLEDDLSGAACEGGEGALGGGTASCGYGVVQTGGD